tara:strand:- start:61 stop:489 length:429 start_codon:yes stop_codon:yes gene_type:complete
MDNIVQDIVFLQQKCIKIDSLDEAQEIADKLFKILKKSNNGVGLAANQIGINKAVCVIDVWRPLWFMNPKITPASSEKIEFEEGCLSFPDVSVKTLRYKHVTVTSDNHEKPLQFGPWNMLECVCIQHEICHLDGETMFDYKL